MIRLAPTGAVAQMLSADGAIDELLERGLTFDPAPPTPAPRPPGPSIGQIMEAEGPPDWDQELAERQAAERAKTELVQVELERLGGGEDTETQPGCPPASGRELDQLHARHIQPRAGRV